MGSIPGQILSHCLLINVFLYLKLIDLHKCIMFMDFQLLLIWHHGNWFWPTVPLCHWPTGPLCHCATVPPLPQSTFSTLKTFLVVSKTWILTNLQYKINPDILYFPPESDSALWIEWMKINAVFWPRWMVCHNYLVIICFVLPSKPSH